MDETQANRSGNPWVPIMWLLALLAFVVAIVSSRTAPLVAGFFAAVGAMFMAGAMVASAINWELRNHGRATPTPTDET